MKIFFCFTYALFLISSIYGQYPLNHAINGETGIEQKIIHHIDSDDSNHYSLRKKTDFNLCKGIDYQGIIDVLILSPDVHGFEEFRAALDAYEHLSVEGFPRDSLPGITLSHLLPYDVVLIFNNNQWLQAGGVSPHHVGNILADYIDQGGFFIENSYVMDYQGWELGGSYATNGYSAFTRADNDILGDFSLGTVHQEGHAILTDVETFSGTGNILVQNYGIAENATRIVDWDNGEVLIAIKGPVVSVNMLPVKSSYINYVGDGTTLYNNAIVWFMYSPGVPGPPVNLTATPGEFGALEVELNWINPDKTLDGEPLDYLENVNIYRNEELIHTISDPVIGQPDSYTDDTMIESGIYNYSVTGANFSGEGSAADVSVFVGEDVPGKPGNIKLTAIGGNGVLTWHKPTEGLHGGYFDEHNVFYSIVRFPDQTEVASEISNEVFTDTTIPEMGNYYYAIIANNDAGQGGSAESNVALLKAENMLLYQTFDYDVGEIPTQWELTGVPHAWGVNNSEFAGGEAPELRLNWFPSVVGESRLVTYPVHFDKHKFLRLRFKQYLNNASSFDGEIAAVDITYDGGGNWDPLWEFVIEQDIMPSELELYVSVPPNNTTLHFGFRFEGNSHNINQWYIDDLVLEIVVDNDLIGESISGNTTPSAGTESIYHVAVTNAGALEQSNYNVKLMMEGGVELAAVEGEPIQFGETIIFDIPWVPTEEYLGPSSIYGYVDFENDEVLDNNQTPLFDIYVLPENVLNVSIGEGEEKSSQPYHFGRKHSISQTIYYPSEIGMGGGVIMGLQYYNTFNNDLLDKEIMIWLGETSKDDLSEEWVDPATMKLVFEGTVDFPKGENEIFILFDESYTYEGDNLVVYSYKADDLWSSGNLFYNTKDEGVGRTRRAQRDSNPYNPINPGVSGVVNDNFPNVKMFIDSSGLGAIQGEVVEDDYPLEDVRVKILGTSLITYSDENGCFEFPYLQPGTYYIEFAKFGYEPIIIENIYVLADEVVNLSVFLAPILKITVGGFVGGSDSPDEGLENATITLTGYSDYETTTDSDGEFVIEGVFVNKTYEISVFHDGYEPHHTQIEVGDTDLWLDDIILIEIALPVSNVQAEKTEAGALITWDEPGVQVEFRYDDGEAVSQLGFTGGDLNSIMGAVHARRAQLHEMTWMLTEQGGPHESVKIWVLGLDTYGLPDRDNVLYMADNVSNTDNEWTNYEFPEPIDAPDGFFIGVSYNGFLGLAVDDGVGSPWEFVPNTQYSISNINDPETQFIDIQSYGFEQNFLMRGYGYDLGPAKFGCVPLSQELDTSPILSTGDYKPFFYADEPEYNSGITTTGIKTIKALERFNVYRLFPDDIDDSEQWVNIASGIEDWEYLDTEFGDMDDGVYQYAVIAVYTNDILSPPSFSNTLGKGMEVEWVVYVTTNSNDPPTGSVIRLRNQNEPQFDYTGFSPPDGVVAFPEVWKGTYTLEAELFGFEFFVQEDIEIIEDGDMDVELIEKILTPQNLDITTEGLYPGQALFTWTTAHEAKRSLRQFDFAKAFYGFNIFLNNMDTPIADGVMNEEYLFVHLPEGEYVAGVQSVHTTGSSEIVTVDFNIIEGVQFFTVTFIIIDEENDEIDDAVIVLGEQENSPGDYVFYDVPMGTYSYHVSKDGYASVEGELTVNEDIVKEVILASDDVGFEDIITPNVMVYPNPSKGIFTVISHQRIIEIRILNLQGQTVKHDTSPEGYQAIVNANHLLPGFYVLEIITPEGSAKKKIVIDY